MTSLTINVVGTPAPQGSKRAFVVNGRARMVESSKKVLPWRQDVIAAIERLLAQSHITFGGPNGGSIRSKDVELPLAGPLRVDITYYLARPRYHYRTGARAHELKPAAPVYVDKKPDLDKLNRATFDALTQSGLIKDDAQIASGLTEKRYADAATGARITITPLVDEPAVASVAVVAEPAEGALF